MKEKKVILHLRARAKVILQKASKSYITGGGGWVFCAPPKAANQVRFYFFIDSTTTIKIGLGHIRSNTHPVTADNIVSNIDQLSKTNPVYLIWVPAHANILGNEIADYLAKRGAKGRTSSDKPPDSFLESISTAR